MSYGSYYQVIRPNGTRRVVSVWKRRSGTCKCQSMKMAGHIYAFLATAEELGPTLRGPKRITVILNEKRYHNKRHATTVSCAVSPRAHLSLPPLRRAVTRSVMKPFASTAGLYPRPFILPTIPDGTEKATLLSARLYAVTTTATPSPRLCWRAATVFFYSWDESVVGPTTQMPD